MDVSALHDLLSKQQWRPARFIRVTGSCSGPVRRALVQLTCGLLKHFTEEKKYTWLRTKSLPSEDSPGMIGLEIIFLGQLLGHSTRNQNVLGAVPCKFF